jgi:hypothetical protein
MISPLLLLFLVGGAVAVAAASSKSSAPTIKGLTLFAGQPNRFVDPILLCLAREKGLYPNVGLGYLSGLGDDAESRVAAMVKRIGPPPPPRVSFPKTTIGDLAEGSFKNIQALGIKLQSVYADESQWGQLAGYFGVPVADIKSQAAQLSSVVGKVDQSEFIKQAAKYAPIAKSIMQGVSGYASGRKSQSEIAMDLGLAAASSLASAAAGVVPVVGAVMSLAIDLTVAELNRKAANKAAECVSRKNEIKDLIQRTTGEGFPYPWHIVDDFGNPCDNYDDFLRVSGALGANLLAFRSLSVRDRGAVAQWWALALSLMSHPEVYAVFDKLGHGVRPDTIGSIANIVPASSLGNGFGYAGWLGLYGGFIASDEQVMLVAAPYAIANGFPVDYFAKALWNVSTGWKGADEVSFMYGKKDRSLYAVWQKSKGDPMSDVNTYLCSGVPLNAWHLQFAALSRDAQALVKTLKKP